MGNNHSHRSTKPNKKLHPVAEILGTTDTEEQLNRIKQLAALANAPRTTLTLEFNWITRAVTLGMHGEAGKNQFETVRAILNTALEQVRQAELKAVSESAAKKDNVVDFPQEDSAEEVFDIEAEVEVEEVEETYDYID